MPRGDAGQMKKRMAARLACPACHGKLGYAGTTAGGRLVDGEFTCPFGHLFQVKGEVPLLKEARLSGGEFSWKVNIPDVAKYDRIRRRYASYLPDGLVEADGRLVRSLAALGSESEWAVDVASGMGTLVLVMAKRLRAGGILATDVDEAPLRGAMQKLRADGSYGRVSLCVMDAKHMAVATGLAPLATSYFGFDNVPDAGAAFAEARRILLPRGKLLFSATFLRRGSRSLRKARELGLGDTLSRASLMGTLERAGFAADEVEEFYEGRWTRNPMDLLPFEGDWFTHALVSAHKKA